ncbi:hypothetical protein V2595_15560, partial [Tenacibaculum maritimum]
MGFFRRFSKNKPSNRVNLKNIKGSIINIFQGVGQEDIEGVKNKSELEQKDYQYYIDNIVLPVSLIKRYIVEQNERKEVQNTLDLSKAKTIFEVLKEEDKIVLLGNPGIGKTIELKRIAVEYWHDQENTFIPIFRNLKNFTKQDTLDSYISINYKSIENVCFVFDGIDEISDIQDFESKL